jgi:hypothetical protein
VISKKRCPHTGILNFFIAADPLISVGSVSKTTVPAQYAWHCYIDDPAAGVALDISIAETALRKAIASRRDLSG